MEEKFEFDEQKRLRALKSYEILDTLSEAEYDGITRLAAQICGTKISLISLIDEDRQWFKSKFGLDASETPRELAFCNHAIQTPNSVFVIEDSTKDDRFKDNPLVKGDPHVIFYAGVPLVDKNQYALGTLCVIDNEPRKLSSGQIDALQTLSKSVINLFELRRKNSVLAEEKNVLLDILEFNNPFYLVLNQEGIVQNIGSNIRKINRDIEIGHSFFNHYNFQLPFDFKKFIESADISSKRLHFFDSLDQPQRFKFSAKKSGGIIILAISPVINAKYHIRNYNLTLNDFVVHDYVSEYIFLQQTTDRSLKESKTVLDSIREKNEELKKVQENLDLIARFPAENPNPIIRLDHNFSLTYNNPISEINFLADFSFENQILGDSELKRELEKLISEKNETASIILKRCNRTYNIGIRNIQNYGYINVYSADITFYINQLEEKEWEITGVKNFYVFILNNIPSDIAVFDSSHKYLFVNPNGISNPEIRKFIVGKDDYDYCSHRGISFEIADKRRKVFNEVLQNKQTVEWEDYLKDSNGNQKVVIRKLAPILDESGNANFVIGYGVDITQRKSAENKLLEATNRLQLLEKFLDRTLDAIQVSDEHGQMIYVNDSAANRLGIDKNEISNYRVEDFEKFFKSDEDWKEHVDLVRNEGKFQVESENKNIKTGEITNVEVSVTYEVFDGIGYLIAASRDISERIKAQHEISKLSMVAKNTNNGVIMIDANRKITWANEAMVKRSGYSMDELLGQSPKMFQFEGTAPKTIEYVYSQLIKLEPVTTEILHQSKSGKL